MKHAKKLAGCQNPKLVGAAIQRVVVGSDNFAVSSASAVFWLLRENVGVITESALDERDGGGSHPPPAKRTKIDVV